MSDRVIVVGAGPVGLTCAALLARATGTFFLTDTMRQPDRERV